MEFNPNDIISTTREKTVHGNDVTVTTTHVVDTSTEVEMLSGNNGKNVFQALSGDDLSAREGEGFENTTALTARVRESGLAALIAESAERNNLGAEEVETLEYFMTQHVEAGSDLGDVSADSRTNQTALLIDEDGLIAGVTNHGAIQDQIGAVQLGGGQDTNTAQGEEITHNGRTFEIKGNHFYSPLAFDLGAEGIETTAGTVDYDIDGDGDLDRINDVLGDGILSFDADGDGVSGEDGSELFGNNTDFGGQQFANGFEALRAMAEQEGLVGGADQTLSSADLAVLEEKYGLGIKLGGYNAEASSLSSAGITSIELGNGRIETVENFDGRGNVIQYQGGASFTLDSGEARDYGDVWHRDWAAE